MFINFGQSYSFRPGVVSPDEVRGVLREDENSGYSALSEEIEGEENPFEDFGGSGFADGRSETSPDSERIEPANPKDLRRNSGSVEQIQDSPNAQDPFECDSRVWRGLPNASPETVRCRRCDQSDLGSGGSGQIFDLTGGTTLDEWNESDHPRDDEGKFGKGGNNINKSTKCDIIRNKQRKEIQLSHEEYAKVMHELNNNLSSEQRKKKVITKNIGDYKYTVLNKGFNEYRIINKRKI